MIFDNVFGLWSIKIKMDCLILKLFIMNKYEVTNNLNATKRKLFTNELI